MKLILFNWISKYIIFFAIIGSAIAGGLITKYSLEFLDKRKKNKVSKEYKECLKQRGVDHAQECFDNAKHSITD